MELDMTKGNPAKLMIKFIIPLIIGNVFQQLYNMADTVIVGRCVGFDALGAVGATGTIMFLILGFATGITTGFTVITAQRYGAGDYDGVKVSVVNAIYLSIVVTIVMTAVSVLGMPWLLTVMNTPPEIYQMSYDYIIVICYGMVFTIWYNIIASLLRAVGNSKAPLYFLLIGAPINISSDLIFIQVFHWGVSGAAIATVMAQALAGIMGVVYILWKVKVLCPSKEHWRIDTRCMRSQISIGLPMALQFSITAAGTILVQSALNKLGYVVVSSYTAASKVCSLVTLPYSAMGITVATYSAQNRGINDIPRIKKGVVIANIISAIYSIVIVFVSLLSLSALLSLFVDKSAGIDFDVILGYAKTYIQVCCYCFIPLGMIFVYRNALQGCGYSIIAMIGGIVELISRATVAFIAADRLSYLGVCLADPITWLVTAVFLFIVYHFTIMRMDKAKKKFSHHLRLKAAQKEAQQETIEGRSPDEPLH